MHHLKVAVFQWSNTIDGFQRTAGKTFVATIASAANGMTISQSQFQLELSDSIDGSAVRREKYTSINPAPARVNN